MPLCGQALRSTSPRTRCGRQGYDGFPHGPPPLTPRHSLPTPAPHAPPPGMQETWGLPQRDVLLPSDLHRRKAGEEPLPSLPDREPPSGREHGPGTSGPEQGSWEETTGYNKGRGAKRRSSDGQTDAAMPATEPDPAQPSVPGAPTEAGRRGPGVGRRGRPLTSERKVCADFWAPMCSRYSYTYSANLQAGGSGSGSQEARGLVSLKPRPQGSWRGSQARHLPSVGQAETRGRGPTLSPHWTHPQPHIRPPNTP